MKVNFTRDKKSGIAVPLLLILSVVIFSFLGLAIDYSIYANNLQKIQNVSNMAALAAIKEFSRNDGVTVRSYQTRIRDGLDAAKEILDKNKLVFVSPALSSNLSLNIEGPQEGSGILSFGNWIVQAPPASQQNPVTCPNSKYPCFIANNSDSVTNTANAARIYLRTQPGTGMSRFFSKFITNSLTFTLEASATSSLEERCVAFLLDISKSAVSDSHPMTTFPQRMNEPTNPTNWPVSFPRTRIKIPRAPGLFAYRRQLIDPILGNNACAGDIYRPEQNYWCNMGTRGWMNEDPNLRIHCARTDLDDDPDDYGLEYEYKGLVRGSYEGDYEGQTSLTKQAGIVPLHFQSDYQLAKTKRGEYYVDRHVRAEPLSTIFSGINSALRDLASIGSINDRVMFLAFDSEIRDSFPQTGFTKTREEIEFLVQLTNYDNIGKVDGEGKYLQEPVHPNFLDRGWFPVWGQAGTNLIDTFGEAIKRLTDSNQCPSHARKVIILSTDGKMSINSDRNGTNTPLNYYGSPNASNPPANHYFSAEKKLLGLNTSGTVGTPTNGILADLVQSKIGVHILQAGNHLGPNFLGVPASGEYRFLSLHEAAQAGFTGLGPKITRFFDTGHADWRGWDERVLLPNTSNFDPPVCPGCPCPNRTHIGYNMGKCGEEIRFGPGEETSAEGCQWFYAGEWEGVTWKRSNGVLGELAMKTAGNLCQFLPIRDPYNTLIIRDPLSSSDPGYVCSNHGAPPDPELSFPYYHDNDGDEVSPNPETPVGGRNCFDEYATPRELSWYYKSAGQAGDQKDLRPGTFIQTYAQELLTPAAQSAKCTRNAVGINPFKLVEEDP